MSTFRARLVSLILAINMTCPLGVIAKAQAGDHSDYEYAGGVDSPKGSLDESGCKAKLSDQDLAELYLQRQKIFEAMGTSGVAPGALGSLNDNPAAWALRENRIAFATIMKVGGCNQAKFKEKIEQNPRLFDAYLNTIPKSENGATQLDDDEKHAMSWFEQMATEIGCNQEKLRMAAVAYAVIAQSEMKKEASRLKYKIWKASKEGKPLRAEDLNYRDQKALKTLTPELTMKLNKLKLTSFLNADDTKTLEGLSQKAADSEISIKEQRAAQNELAEFVNEKRDKIAEAFLGKPQDRIEFAQADIEDNYAASYAELEKNEVTMQLEPDSNPKAAQPGEWKFSYNNYKDKFKDPKFEAAFHRIFGDLSDKDIAKTHQKSGFTPTDATELYIHTFQRYWERDKLFDDAHVPGQDSERAKIAYANRDENLAFVAESGQSFSLRPPQTWNGQKDVVRIESQEWMEKRIMEGFKKFEEGVNAYHEALAGMDWTDAKNQFIESNAKLESADIDMREGYKQLAALKIPGDQLNALAKIQGELASKSAKTVEEAYQGYKKVFITTSVLALTGPLAWAGEAGVGAGAGVYAGIARAGTLARNLMGSFATGVALTTVGHAVTAMGDVQAGYGNYWCNLSREFYKSLPTTLVNNMAYAPLGPIMGKVGKLSKLQMGKWMALRAEGPRVTAWLARTTPSRIGMTFALHAPTTGLALTGGKFMFGEENPDEGFAKSGLRKVFGQESVLGGGVKAYQMNKQSDELKVAAQKQQEEALKMMASGKIEEQQQGRELLMQAQEMAKRSDVLKGEKYEAVGSTLVGLAPIAYGMRKGVLVSKREVYEARAEAMLSAAEPTLKAQGISPNPAVRSATVSAIADHLEVKNQEAFNPNAPEYTNFAETVARNKIQSIALAKKVGAGSVTQEPLASNATTAARQKREYQEGVQALEQNLDLDMLRQNTEAQKNPVTNRQEWQAVAIPEDLTRLSELQGTVISGLSESEVAARSFVTNTTKKTEIVSGQVEKIEFQKDSSGKATKATAKVRVVGKGGRAEIRDVVLSELDPNGQPKKAHLYKVEEPTPISPDDFRVESRNRTEIDRTNMRQTVKRSMLAKAVAKMNPDPALTFVEAALVDVNPKDPATGGTKYNAEQVAAVKAHVLEEIRQYGPTSGAPTDNLKTPLADITTASVYFSPRGVLAVQGLILAKTMLTRSSTAVAAVKGSFLEATMKHYLEHPAEMNPPQPREATVTLKTNIEALVKGVTKETFVDDTFSRNYALNTQGLRKFAGKVTKGIGKKLFGGEVPEPVQRAAEARLELLYKRTGMTPELGGDKVQNSMWKQTTAQIIAQENARYNLNVRAAAQMVKAGKIPSLKGLEPAILARYQADFIKELQSTGEQIDANMPDHQKHFAEFVQAEINRGEQPSSAPQN